MGQKGVVMKYIFSILLVLVFTACSSGPTTKLSSKGKNVQIIEGKPESDCEIVGKVVGENGFGSVDVARNDARNKVGDLDGNWILIKEEVPTGNAWKVHALGYKCP
jgi:hypothetical protein